MPYLKNITKCIGKTPLIEIHHCFKTNNTILAKLENINPLKSIKDRSALYMIQEAEKKKFIKAGSTILEATSGNTGIALSYLSRLKGYKVILAMPEKTSFKNEKLFRLLGAEILLTPSEEGMSGAIKKVKDLSQNKGFFWINQFKNKANVKAHYETTGPEIWEDTKGNIDLMFIGVGTGGTIMGVGNYLKKQNKNIKIIAVEPKESAVLSGNKAGFHFINGIGAGFIPDNYDTKIVDDIIAVSSEQALMMTKKLILKEGILGGVSSGASLLAIKNYVERYQISNKKIGFFICDSGERYQNDLLKINEELN